MRALLVAAFWVPLLLGRAFGADAILPDHKLTPGLLRPDATAQQLCAKGFTTRRYRHTTAAMKATVYREYGRTKKPGVCCEVDHLVPLELGGADDVKNLWPQPYEPVPGAHQKDLVEDCLHRLVCTGKVSLPDAQHRLIANWYAEYDREKRGGECE